MNRLVVLLTLLAVLIIVNAGFVSGAEDPAGGCTCEYLEGVYVVGWNDCDSICESPSCNSITGACSCVSISDIDSDACNSPTCPYNPNIYFNHGYYFSTTIYNRGDADVESRCCLDDPGENYVYSTSWNACCDDAFDCPSSTNTCIDTGLLMPGKSEYVCRDNADDWVLCSSTSNANTLYTAGGNDYCCAEVLASNWEWVGPFCTCSYSEPVCTGSSCGGSFALDFFTGDPDDGSCCTGALIWKQEVVGYVAGETCGTLEPSCADGCFCLDPPLW